MYTLYSDIPAKLRNRESFDGNSMHAYKTSDNYVVWSYRTKIYDEARGYWDTDYYSSTTSRHQNLVRKHIITTRRLRSTRRTY
jgi:hypothetical protein